jgi:hypothetical protein
MKIQEKFLKLLRNYLGILGIEFIFNDITSYHGSYTHSYLSALFGIVVIELISFTCSNKNAGIKASSE